MSYIGKEPIVGNFQKCDAITTSSTATYNLTVSSVAVSPETANNCIVSLNGVIQAPTSAYTISGSQIVFNSSLTSSDVVDFILILGSVLSVGTPTDRTVSLAKLATGTDGNLITYDASGNPAAVATGSDGQVLTSAGAGQPPAFEAAASGGKLLQSVSVTTDGVSTSTAAGVPSTITNGGQLFTYDFTPTASSSTILVMTSTISISEESNSANIPWLALWNGSSFVAATSGHAIDSRYAGSLLAETFSMCHTFSAGSTSERAIQVRGGLDGGTVYLNGASSANYTGSSARISMIIQEIGS